MSYIRLALLALMIFNSGIANANDGYELGIMQGNVVRTAIISDTYELQCNVDNTNKRWNMAEYLFKWKWNTTLNEFLANLGKKALGMTGPSVKEMVTNDAKTEIQKLGGCKTKKTKAWVNEINKIFIEDYDDLARGVPRN